MDSLGLQHHHRKKFLDIQGRVTNIQAPPVDHDHESGFIRGILSEKVNLLLDQWEKNTYGNLSKPPELSEYQKNPPAFKCIGKIKNIISEKSSADRLSKDLSSWGGLDRTKLGQFMKFCTFLGLAPTL